ncbi:MAG: hypothetical protein IPM89_01950 [Candidatus Competibacteraceae bacterium]|nr:MAG: hypothetical protein IPM89_01950 [Candidatus Competibacteraceae bacterium]
MARRRRDTPRLKILMAQESARIMVEEGVQDFRSAKRKAAIRLAVTDKAALPDNAEIEQALLDYQRLFHADRQALRLRGLRETAVEIMRFLGRFRPRLVGPVLSGATGPHVDIHLHLFADTPTDVLLFLMEHHIPFDTTEHRIKLGNGDPVCLPAFRLDADGSCIDLTIFAPLAEREAPRSPVDGRPMRRASLAEVQALLAEDRQQTPPAAPER